MLAMMITRALTPTLASSSDESYVEYSQTIFSFDKKITSSSQKVLEESRETDNLVKDLIS